MSNKSRIYTIIITALVTCFLTLTVENIITAQTTGNAMRKISLINEILSEYSLFDVDEDKIADYAVQSFANLVKAGIIVGDGYSLTPLKNTTKAEAVTAVCKIIK